MATDNIESLDDRAEVLFVDLDGTLVATDLVWESLFATIGARPLDALRIPAWFARGRPYLKRKLAERSTPDFPYLPLRAAVIDFLKQRRADGCRLALATASDRLIAEPLAAYLGLFADVLCTDGKANLKGKAKLAAIQAWCQARGIAEFSYVGDAWADLPIWRRAARIYAVAPGGALRSALERLQKPLRVLVEPGPLAGPLLRALRPHQWFKNLLLFVPVILGHKVGDLDRLHALALAFVAFSCTASAVYLLNDLLDLAADRRHPVKRLRPFASGALPLSYGPLLILALAAVGFGISLALLPPKFAGLLGLYLAINLGYSGWLKHKPIVDVLLLAGMYTLRLLAGGAAADIVVSEWLLAFSTFFFVSLAFAKRYSELIRVAAEQGADGEARGYLVSDVSLIESMGSCSGYLSVLVLALYMNSEQVQKLYTNSRPLWLVCVLLLFWISRLWFWTKRGKLAEDPVVFALTDPTSISVGVATLGLVALATLWN